MKLTAGHRTAPSRCELVTAAIEICREFLPEPFASVVPKVPDRSFSGCFSIHCPFPCDLVACECDRGAFYSAVRFSFQPEYLMGCGASAILLQCQCAGSN